VKAQACARPSAGGRPLGRLSVFEVCRQVWAQGVTVMSYSTVWRRLHEDLLRPWFQRVWIFPRDPLFLQKATPVLDLYQGRWQGEPLLPGDRVLCGDEMPGIQALRRIHAPLPAGPHRKARHEFEYERLGTLCYHAFLDVFTGKAYGQIHASTGIEPFQASLKATLAQPEFAEAERIFVVLDNGSSHHPRTSPARLQALDPRLVAVHLPAHASWLNQLEIFFSILVRKGIGPPDFDSLDQLRDRIYRFTSHYNQEARPFNWTYTPEKLKAYLTRLAEKSCAYADQLEALGLHVDGTPRVAHLSENGPASLGAPAGLTLAQART